MNCDCYINGLIGQAIVPLKAASKPVSCDWQLADRVPTMALCGQIGPLNSTGPRFFRLPIALLCLCFVVRFIPPSWTTEGCRIGYKWGELAVR